MTEADIQRLVAQGRIERIEPDAETAREEITTARRHLVAVQAIAHIDPTLAFTGLYDAMRKAIQAHMRAHVYRVTKGPGSHVKTGAGEDGRRSRTWFGIPRQTVIGGEALRTRFGAVC